MVADGAGDADATRRGKPLQPRCDPNAAAIDVVAIGDHVAEIDADAKSQAVLLGEIQIAIGHRPLDFTPHSAPRRRRWRIPPARRRWWS